jgi:hypothetical protein
MRRFADMYGQCVDRVLESGFGVYTDTQIALCMRLAGVEVPCCCCAAARDRHIKAVGSVPVAAFHPTNHTH